jgi:hypothetical protein
MPFPGAAAPPTPAAPPVTYLPDTTTRTTSPITVASSPPMTRPGDVASTATRPTSGQVIPRP